MALREPSPEDVDQFMAVTMCDERDVGVVFLQRANYQLDAAVWDYMENPHRYAKVGHLPVCCRL
jgi:hypothetical protein